jgi:hypothetical protein
VALPSILIAISLFLHSLSISGFQQKIISGTWKGNDGNKEVNVIIKLKNADEYEGVTLTSENEHKVILRQVKYNSKNRNYTGKMIPPDAGVELKATITMIDENTIQIDAEKFVLRKKIILYRIK